MTAADDKNQRYLTWWLFAVIWFAGCHLWHTWSVWGDPINRVPGPVGDNMVMLWNLGWVRHALNHGSPGFWFTNAYYPDGFLFLFSTHTWLDGVLGWLASPLMPAGYQGAVLWANITMLFATVTSGLLIIGGLRIWGIRVWPLLILISSGVTFCWFRMFALTGHYHFYGTQWMLAAMVFASMGRRSLLLDRVQSAYWYFFLSGALTGLAFLNDQTMAVFAGILGLLIILSTGRGGLRQVATTKQFIATLCFYGSAVLVAAVHLIPIVQAMLSGKLTYSLGTSDARLVDASSLILPPEYHFLGTIIADYRQFHGLQWAEGTYLGLIPMMFLAIGSVAAVQYLLSRRKSPVSDLRVCCYAVLAAWVFILIALGDTLLIGRDTFIALPARLITYIPVLNNIRLPQRWIWPAQLCIAIGGGSALSYYIAHWHRTTSSWVLMVLACVPPLEGKLTLPPVDFRTDSFVRPAKLVEAVSSSYTHGGLLMMPIEAAYAHGNVLQFLWGYDIPLTVAYSARMPFSIHSLPWRGSQWGSGTGSWLQSKKVTIIVFPFHDGNLTDYQPWLRKAKESVPDLKVFNRTGNLVQIPKD